MKWKMVSRNIVVHEDGHKIELKSGSWRAPMEIHPKIVRGTSAVEFAKLIREGLDFAHKHSTPKPTSIYRRRTYQTRV